MEEVEIEMEPSSHSREGLTTTVGHSPNNQRRRKSSSRVRRRRPTRDRELKESSQRFQFSSQPHGGSRLEEIIEQNKHIQPSHKEDKIQKLGLFHSWFQSSSSSSSSLSSLTDDEEEGHKNWFTPNRKHTFLSPPEGALSSSSSSSSSSTSSRRGSSASSLPTPYEAAFMSSNLPRFSSEFIQSDSTAMQAKYRKRDVMGIEILSTGEKTYFTKTLRDLCVLVNSIANHKEQARFKETQRGSKNDGCGTGWMVPRDLRRLDFFFFPNLEPQILPRRHCLIFAIEQLRGLLTEDRLILLLPPGADEFLQMIDKRLAHTLEYPKLSTKKYSLYPQPEPFFLSNENSNISTRGVFHDEGVESQSKLQLDVIRKEKWKRRDGRMAEEEQEEERGAEEGRGEEEENREDEGEEGEEGEDEEDEEGAVFLTFELRVLDSILETVVWLKQRELRFISDRKERFFYKLKKKASLLTSTRAHEELRILRTEVLTMITRLTNIRRVLEELLDNEEDMALFNLSLLAAEPALYDPPLKPQILEAHTEVELLLEAYLQNFHEILTDLDVMVHELNATEALMSLRLDTARNQLLSYTTIFSLIGMAFAIGSYVGSLFGTNLENGLEMSGTGTFVYVSVGTTVGVLLIIVGFGILLKQKGMLVK